MAGLPLVGDEFAGYRVRAVLGRGGMSVVYQAENLRLSSVRHGGRGYPARLCAACEPVRHL